MLDFLLETFRDPVFAIWGPFVVLLLCGFGLPIPEDIVLATAGVLAAEFQLGLIKPILVTYVGILVGDFTMYLLGRRFGNRLASVPPFSLVIPPERLRSVGSYFQKYGSGVVFVGRFLPGLRAPIFFTAGTVRYSWIKFLFMDGLAAIVSAPFFVWLGHFMWEKFGEDFHQLEKSLGRVQVYVVVGALALALGLLLQIWRKSKKSQSG